MMLYCIEITSYGLLVIVLAVLFAVSLVVHVAVIIAVMCRRRNRMISNVKTVQADNERVYEDLQVSKNCLFYELAL